MLVDTFVLDIIFSIGTILFLAASVPAISKLYRVENSDAQSLVHNEMHLMALLTMFTAYFLAQTPISLCVTSTEIMIRIYLIMLIRKKRSHKLKYKSDIIYYLFQYIKKILGR